MANLLIIIGNAVKNLSACSWLIVNAALGTKQNANTPPYASHLQLLRALLHAQRRLQRPLQHAARLRPHPITPLLPPHVFDSGSSALAEQTRVSPQLLDARAAGAADGANFGLPPAVARRLRKGKCGSNVFMDGVPRMLGSHVLQSSSISAAKTLHL